MLTKAISFAILLVLWLHSSLAVADDLSQCTIDWTPATTPVVELDGTWCISHQGQAALAEVPGLWHREQIDGQTIPGVSVVVYRLRIVHGFLDEALSIRLPRPYDRYRVMINGRAISPDGAIPYFEWRQPHYWQFNSAHNHTDLLIEVSNARFVSGGLREAPRLGLSNAMNQQRLQNLSIEALQSCLLLLMAFILFAQYAAMRRLYSAGIFFGITCLGVALFAGLGGEQWLSLVLAPLDLRPELNLRWAMIAISVLGLSEFTFRVYPREFHKPINTAWRVVTGVFLTACVVLPPRWLAWTFWGMEFVALLMSAYLVATVIRAAWHRRENARATATLYGLLFLAVAHDILTDFAGLYAGNLGPTAMVLCLVGQGLVLSRQNAQAHIQSLHLVEKLERAEKIKDEFLANTSHELRTPLQTIIGLASSAEIKKPKLIADTAKRLALLVDDLMDLTRMRHQQMQISRDTVPVKAELETLQQLFLPLLNNRDLDLRIELESPSLSVQADARRLRQVLYNLLGNAVKYTARGHITLYAKRSGQRIRLGVRDTGPGIDGSHAALNRYWQGTPSSDGAGLGLPISQGILEAHQSELCIASSHNGTDIYFELAAGALTSSDQAPTESPIPAETSPPIEALCPSDNYLLILDDDGAVLESLSHMLQPLNLHIVRESRVEHAMRRINERLPALLILDVMMPQISGFEILQTLRQQYDPTMLPILVLTARQGRDDQRRALTLGANDYAVKPCDPLELLERVRAQLRHQPSSQPARTLAQLSAEILNSPRPLALIDNAQQLLDANTAGREALLSQPDNVEFKLALGHAELWLWPADNLPEEPRTLLVTSLQRAFSAWQEQGGNRTSLAEQSRQWRVQLDGSTARARTFDRYFSTATLPKRPNVAKVINPLRFVVSQLPQESRELQQCLLRLERIQSNNRSAFNA